MTASEITASEVERRRKLALEADQREACRAIDDLAFQSFNFEWLMGDADRRLAQTECIKHKSK